MTMPTLPSDDQKFGYIGLVLIGVVSGIAVSAVKALQLGYGPHMTGLQIGAALFTFGLYMLLGAIGSVFLIEHAYAGAKMLKNAFLMGFVAPSFLLALATNPNPPIPKLGNIQNIPQLSFLIGAAYAADEAPKPEETTKPPSISQDAFKKKLILLDKSAGTPTFPEAVRHALGTPYIPDSYAYIVGATSDETKALTAAQSVDKILAAAGYKNLQSKIIKTRGQPALFVTIGNPGTPDQASIYQKVTFDAALKELEGANSKEAKEAASNMLKGQVVDARDLLRAQ